MGAQLQGKIAIVTGASDGIGRGIAETFAAEGAKIVLVARRKELLDDVAAGIKARGGEALPIVADLTREDAVTALFATVAKGLPPPRRAGEQCRHRHPPQHRRHHARLLARSARHQHHRGVSVRARGDPHHEGAGAEGRRHHQYRQRLGEERRGRICCPTP